MIVWFLTRSYPPYQNTGGALIRKAYVENLRTLGWNVIVVMPCYNSKKYSHTKDMIQIPFILNKKLSILLEMLGIYEDYLDKWVDEAFLYLKKNIKKEDIIFATSGGELGMIKLGVYLKKEIMCKLVVNLHDPIDFTFVNGLKINKRFHVSREKNEKKYLSYADLIITSSKSYEIFLQDKYPNLDMTIVNNYFGYIKPVILSIYDKKPSKKLRIAYVGNMESAQKPEILLKAFQNAKLKNYMEIYFIGDSKNYLPLQNIQSASVHCIEYLPHHDFVEFMIKNIDVGFVSLADDYYSVCVPSKIYEYINLGLPILGALPTGDARNLINKQEYGLAYHHNDIDKLSNALDQFIDKDFLSTIQLNIIKNKEQWSMKKCIKEVSELLVNLKKSA